MPDDNCHSGSYQEWWDFDKVEGHNAPASFLAPWQGGTPKTDALRANVAYLCQDEDDDYDIRMHEERFPGPQYPMCETDILIVAVDDLEVRQRIWNMLRAERAQFAERGEEHPVKLLIDARSGKDWVTIYTVAFSDENADTSIYDASFTRGSAPIRCSERSVAYNSSTCAGFVCRMVAAFAWGDYIPKRVTVNHKTFFVLVQ